MVFKNFVTIYLQLVGSPPEIKAAKDYGYGIVGFALHMSNQTNFSLDNN
jgi:hypothetical protein